MVSHFGLDGTSNPATTTVSFQPIPEVLSVRGCADITPSTGLLPFFTSAHSPPSEGSGVRVRYDPLLGSGPMYSWEFGTVGDARSSSLTPPRFFGGACLSVCVVCFNSWWVTAELCPTGRAVVLTVQGTGFGPPGVSVRVGGLPCAVVEGSQNITTLQCSVAVPQGGPTSGQVRIPFL